MNDKPGPLHGYRVLDFGWVLAGAIPGMVLADMGAEVIKVETRQRLDYMRLGRPIVGDQPDPEQNPMFHNVNRNKLSITLNTTHPEAVDLARRLVEHVSSTAGTARRPAPLFCDACAAINRIRPWSM